MTEKEIKQSINEAIQELVLNADIILQTQIELIINHIFNKIKPNLILYEEDAYPDDWRPFDYYSGEND